MIINNHQSHQARDPSFPYMNKKLYLRIFGIYIIYIYLQRLLLKPQIHFSTTMCLINVLIQIS